MGIFIELKGPSQPLSKVPSGELKQIAKQIVEDEVKRRIDTKFEERVEAEKEKRVASIIEEEKQKVWIPWLDDAHLRLEEVVRTRVFGLLTEPWPLVCPRCNRPKTHIPTGENWGYLLTSRSVNVPCENPLCLNHTPSPVTGITVTLAELIDRELERTRSGTSQRSNDTPVIF